MKILIVFYSRTGVTKKVAEMFARILKCDIEEIIDLKDRGGVLGYLKSGNDATVKELTEIKEIKNNPLVYDRVIIGTPVWAFTMSAAVRTYITQNKERFKEVAFFCTMASVGAKRTFREMSVLCAKVPIKTIEFKSQEVNDDRYILKLEEFVKCLYV